MIRSLSATAKCVMSTHAPMPHVTGLQVTKGGQERFKQIVDTRGSESLAPFANSKHEVVLI